MLRVSQVGDLASANTAVSRNTAKQTSAYESSKHAVHSLTDALREEASDFNDVALICPGLVVSVMTEGHGISGMATDKFTSIAMEEIKAGNFYSVSHAYNMELAAAISQ